jgi:RimJ/RimL family protein N-acetyltransferase
MTGETVFETERLRVRRAVREDAGMFVALWTDPRVMTNVGFPEGLAVTREEIEANIAEEDDSEFENYLVAVRKGDGAVLGECKLKHPDDEGIAETDVKLLPEHWGHRYGAEVKQGLVDHLFTHTDCRAVQGSPNVKNIASIRMQEAVGAVRVDEKTYEFPEGSKQETASVHHYIYRVFREVWRERRSNAT